MLTANVRKIKKYAPPNIIIFLNAKWGLFLPESANFLRSKNNVKFQNNVFLFFIKNEAARTCVNMRRYVTSQEYPLNCLIAVLPCLLILKLFSTPHSC